VKAWRGRSQSEQRAILKAFRAGEVRRSKLLVAKYVLAATNALLKVMA
jgi:hypothetical protein